MKKISVFMCSIVISLMFTACNTIKDNDTNMSSDDASFLETLDSLSDGSYPQVTESIINNLSSDTEYYTATTLTTSSTTTYENPPKTTTVTQTPSPSTSYATEYSTIPDVTEQTEIDLTSTKKNTEETTTVSSNSSANTETTTTLNTEVQPSGDEREIIELVNLERSKNGLQPLTTNSKISEIARERAEELVELFSDEHTRPDGRGFDTILKDYYLEYSYVAENIARGSYSPDDIMNQWLNSPSQRENILNSNFQIIGVARYEYEDEIYWVQFFYTP